MKLIIIALDVTMLSKEQSEEIYPLISLEAQNQVNRYQDELDKKRSLLGNAAVRYLLAKEHHLPMDAIQICRHQDGKKYAANGINSHFNISHSGDWVVVAIDHVEIGIDIEKIHSVELEPLLRFFHEEERQYVLSLPNSKQQEEFFRLWTAKESYLKATGIGLRQDLASFIVPFTEASGKIIGQPASEIKEYYTTSFPFQSSYYISICRPAAPADQDIHVFDTDLFVKEILAYHGEFPLP